MKTYKKIDLFCKKTGAYICSTIQSKTCKAAAQKYFEIHGEEVTARFDKSKS
jgi:hypothetical protein